MIPNTQPYSVVDTRTGEVLYRTTYARRNAARSYAEKHNQEWGAYRFVARLERDRSAEPAPTTQANRI